MDRWPPQAAVLVAQPDPPGKEQTALLGGPTMGAVYAVALSADGKVLASAGADKLIHLWDTTSWRERGSPLVAESTEKLEARLRGPAHTLVVTEAVRHERSAGQRFRPQDRRRRRAVLQQLCDWTWLERLRTEGPTLVRAAMLAAAQALAARSCDGV